MLSDSNPPKWDFSPKVTCIQCFASNTEIKKSYLCITVKHNADVYKTWCTFRVVFFLSKYLVDGTPTPTSFLKQ